MLLPVTSFKRSYGWRRQPHDPRDIHIIVPNRLTVKLALSDDLSAGMGPQLDQGAEGSCGPNTADELVWYDQKAEGTETGGASRLFVYYFTRQLMGTVNQDSGVDNRTMLKAMAQYGFPLESLWPYDDSFASMVKQPSASVIAAAKVNAISDYQAVVQSLPQMQAVINTLKKPFMFGFDVFNQMEGEEAAKTGLVANPPAGASPIGGHDVSFVGYNATSGDMPGVLPQNRWPAGMFKFRNHWMNRPTESWGDGGYGYISFSYATNAGLSSDFWVINSVPGGVTPPPPLPPPPPPPGTTHVFGGSVQNVSGSTLDLVLGQGGHVKKFNVPATCPVELNHQAAKLTDLAAGMRCRVTVDTGAPTVPIKVEALKH